MAGRARDAGARRRDGAERPHGAHPRRARPRSASRPASTRPRSSRCRRCSRRAARRSTGCRTRTRRRRCSRPSARSRASWSCTAAPARSTSAGTTPRPTARRRVPDSEIYTIIPGTMITNPWHPGVGEEGPIFTTETIRADPRYKGGLIGFALKGDQGQDCKQTHFSEQKLNPVCSGGVCATADGVARGRDLAVDEDAQRLLHRLRGSPHGARARRAPPTSARSPGRTSSATVTSTTSSTSSRA